MDADTKLVPTWAGGPCDRARATAAIADLADRTRRFTPPDEWASQGRSKRSRITRRQCRSTRCSITSAASINAALDASDGSREGETRMEPRRDCGAGRLTWQHQARLLKREVYALYFAVRDPRVPWYAKALAGCVVAYALSPIDLIPDPIPVLGHLDDLVLIPLGVLAVRRMIPDPVMTECRSRPRPGSRSRQIGSPLPWSF